MYNPSKISTQLKLALSMPLSVRSKSLDLNEGYNNILETWELIVRFTGNIDALSKEIGFEYSELKNNYAIIKIRIEKIEQLSQNPAIIFIEKPSRFYFENNMPDFRFIRNSFSGKNVLVAIIDSGIDYTDSLFWNNNETSIQGIYDLSLDYDRDYPNRLGRGRFFDKETIEAAILNNEQLLTYDETGHGSAVSHVIIQNARDVNILAIKLKNKDAFNYDTASIMLAIDFAIGFALENDYPLVINMSLGNNYGDHSGNSILEQYIDSVSNLAKLCIITGMGNEGNSGRHAFFVASSYTEKEIAFQVYPFQNAINLQIWRDFIDEMDIYLKTPSGIKVGPFNLYTEAMEYNLLDMVIGVLNGFPTPYNKNQETYICITPKGEYIQQGIWTIIFETKSILNGKVNLWLPVASGTSSEVRFLQPDANISMTIPASSNGVISVGAYDKNTLTYAPFSGRGYTSNGVVKPDVLAPGVDIPIYYSDGRISFVSGTSFSAPYISAVAAKLMEWGIVNKNDPYMYGEKLKANIIKMAKPLPGYNKYPNEEAGWGML